MNLFKSSFLFLVPFYFCQINLGLAQSTGMSGYITGDKVNMRTDHTTQASAIMLLKKGQSIRILKSYRPDDNSNEAILRTSTDFYNEDYGQKVFTLPKGKAVLVKGRPGDQCAISFRNESTGKIGYAKIQTHLLEFIGGDTWYYIETEGRKGWVFGKYVSYN